MCSNSAEPWIDECERAVAACVTPWPALQQTAMPSAWGRWTRTWEGIYLDVVASLVLAYLVQVRGLHGRVVAGVASSNTLRRTAEMLGCRVVVKPVGYTYIYEELHRSDVPLATDGQGGICIPKHSRERDGILAVAALTDLMVRTGKGLKQLSRELVERVGKAGTASETSGSVWSRWRCSNRDAARCESAGGRGKDPGRGEPYGRSPSCIR